MVLVEQINALLEYLECHSELTLGHLTKTKEGRSLSRRLWIGCAEILNCISPNCPTKTGDEWRLYYNEMKYKTQKKIKALKAEQSTTGGGVAKPIIITPAQERLYNILGRDLGDPLPEVQCNLLSQEEALSENNTNSPNINIAPSPHPTSLPPPTQAHIVAPSAGGARKPPVLLQRRRRRRRLRRQRTPDEDMAQLVASQRRLERVEQQHTKAILAQARATDRLAAAIERAVERLCQVLQ